MRLSLWMPNGTSTGWHPLTAIYRCGWFDGRLDYSNEPRHPSSPHSSPLPTVEPLRLVLSSSRRIGISCAGGAAQPGGGLLGRCPCVHPVLARTSQFTTRPAPQVKDLRHGQLLYSSCTVGSGGLLRKLQKRTEPTIGLEPMTCRFQIGSLGKGSLSFLI